MRSDTPARRPACRRLFVGAAMLAASCGPEVESIGDTTSGADTSVATFVSFDSSTSPSGSTSTGADESSSATAGTTTVDSDTTTQSTDGTTFSTTTNTSDTSTSDTTTTTTESSSTGPPPDPVCGNPYLERDELCDDGNAYEYDGCTSSCTLSERSISAGGYHTCSTNDGALRCWGLSGVGVLGIPFVDAIGDDEPASDGDVDAGGLVVQVVAGLDQTCALLVGGDVRCWGMSPNPQREIFGDDEPASAAPLVELGARAIGIAVGGTHVCALLEGGAVRCWGYNYYGELGYGNTDPIGINLSPSPAEAGDVDVGAE